MLFYKDLLEATPGQSLDFEGLPPGGGDPATAIFGRHRDVGWYVAPITWCESFGPADAETNWSKEKRWMLGFLTVDNTVDPRGSPQENELPSSPDMARPDTAEAQLVRRHVRLSLPPIHPAGRRPLLRLACPSEGFSRFLFPVFFDPRMAR